RLRRRRCELSAPALVLRGAKLCLPDVDNQPEGNRPRPELLVDVERQGRPYLVLVREEALAALVIDGMDAEPDDLARLLSGDVCRIAAAGAFRHAHCRFFLLESRAGDAIAQLDLTQVHRRADVCLDLDLLSRYCVRWRNRDLRHDGRQPRGVVAVLLSGSSAG